MTAEVLSGEPSWSILLVPVTQTKRTAVSLVNRRGYRSSERLGVDGGNDIDCA